MLGRAALFWHSVRFQAIIESVAMKFSMLAACVAVLAGCAAGGVKVTDQQVAAFKAGETTKSTVLATFGEPTMQMRLADGSTMVVYSHYEATVRPATFIPIVGAFAGGSDTRSSTMTLRFDAADKLIDTTSSSSAIGTGTGLAAGRPVPVEDQPRK